MWIVVLANALALILVAWLMYNMGQHSGGESVSVLDSLNVAGSGNGGKLMAVLALAGIALGFTFVHLSSRVLSPVKQLADFAERFSHGDYRARAPAL